MMQDRKALQAGTSHFLGQNFAKAQQIRYQDPQGELVYAWTTSWGVSTRLIGALIMTHSDDDGLVLPPRLAPAHVVILPIYRDDAQRTEVLEYCRKLKQQIASLSYDDQPLRVEMDDRDLRGGEKKWYHVRRGVPIRVEVGPKDIAQDALFVGRRDSAGSQSMPRPQFLGTLPEVLQEMQQGLFDRALKMRQDHTVSLDTVDQFREFFQGAEDEKGSFSGGFAHCYFASEDAVADELAQRKVTIRCIPLDQPSQPGRCFVTGQPTSQRAIFAKAY
jgi:prolyl-tRNA synthetase